MSDVRKVSGNDILDAIARVGVTIEKIEDAKQLLWHISEDFFNNYDHKNEEGRHFITYYFEHFASCIRVLGVCLDDLQNEMSKADDVLSNVRVSDVVFESSDNVAEKVGGDAI